MKRNTSSTLAVLVSVAALTLASQAKAATQQYFDINGTTAGYGTVGGGSFSWEGAYWATASGGTTATSTYVNDGTGFPRFYAGTSGDTYTVAAGQTENTVGFYQSGSGITVNLVQANASGLMNLSGTGGGTTATTTGAPATLQYVNISSGSTINEYIPISGTGGIAQHGSGALSLLVPNTFAGNYETTGGQATNFNNNSPFGTGTVYVSGAGQFFVNVNTSTPLTISNPFYFETASSNSLFYSLGSASSPGVTYTGTFTLPTTGSYTINKGIATSYTKITGPITSAGGGVTFAGVGMLTLTGANTYTGATTVSAGKLKLGATNTIASTSGLIMGGGTLETGGFNQSMTAATLQVTANSVISFADGAAEVDFANSSGVAWTSGTTLTFPNFDPTLDKVRFGVDATGLTAGQLAQISFNGGTAALDANGYLVPEPSSALLLGVGSLILAARRRQSVKA